MTNLALLRPFTYNIRCSRNAEDRHAIRHRLAIRMLQLTHIPTGAAGIGLTANAVEWRLSSFQCFKDALSSLAIKGATKLTFKRSPIPPD